MPAFGITLVAAAAFIFLVDPAQRWRRSVRYPSRPLTDHEVWVGPAINFPEREIRLDQMRSAPKPDLVILGSSRAMLIDSGLFRRGLIVRNLGVSGASVEDDVALWEILKRLHKRPRYVLLSLDPWILNRNAGQDRWMALASYRDAFLWRINPSVAEGVRRSVFRIRSTLLQSLQEMTGLLSWGSLKASIKLVRHPKVWRERPFITLEETRPEDSTGYRSDGSFLYPQNFVRPKTSSEIEDLAREFALGREVYSLGRWTFDPDAIYLLNLLLDDMRRDSVQVIMVLPPYQPLAGTLVRQRSGYESVLDDSTSAFREMASKHPEAAFCDATQCPDSGCLPTEFLDGMHMSHSGVEKVIKHCFKHVSPWTSLLSADKHDAHIPN